MTHHYTVDSPLGPLHLVASNTGLTGLYLPNDTLDPRAAPDGVVEGANDVIATACEQLAAYFAGTLQRFDVPLDLVGTPFQQRIWAALLTIPIGETVTYLELGARAGEPGKPRATGAANGRNPVSIIVPCHRVVGSNGNLTGYSGGLEAKRWLLDHEATMREAA